MEKTIQVNGRSEVVLNSYSAGPGETPYQYDIRGGYVFQAGGWFLQRPGQFAQAVKVVR